jgi:hypothetical protein
MIAQFQIQLLTLGVLVCAIAIGTIMIGAGRDRLHGRDRIGPTLANRRGKVFPGNGRA